MPGWKKGVKKWRTWSRWPKDHEPGAPRGPGKKAVECELAMRKKVRMAAPQPINLRAATRGAAFEIPLSRLMAGK